MIETGHAPASADAPADKLPAVATTERRIVPRSTTAILAGSIVVEAPVRAVKPQMPATTIRTKTETMRVLRDFFITT